MSDMLHVCSTAALAARASRARECVCACVQERECVCGRERAGGREGGWEKVRTPACLPMSNQPHRASRSPLLSARSERTFTDESPLKPVMLGGDEWPQT